MTLLLIRVKSALSIFLVFVSSVQGDHKYLTILKLKPTHATVRKSTPKKQFKQVPLPSSV